MTFKPAKSFDVSMAEKFILDVSEWFHIGFITKSINLRSSCNLYQHLNHYLQDVKWRRENKMNTIHTEDFEDTETAGYISYVESFDREGIIKEL